MMSCCVIILFLKTKDILRNAAQSNVTMYFCFLISFVEFFLYLLSTNNPESSEYQMVLEGIPLTWIPRLCINELNIRRKN